VFVSTGEFVPTRMEWTFIFLLLCLTATGFLDEVAIYGLLVCLPSMKYYIVMKDCD